MTRKRFVKKTVMATGALLLSSLFVMGNHYVAHDFLCGRGDASTIASQLSVLIAVFLAIYFTCLYIKQHSPFTSAVHNFLAEDKAPPTADDLSKLRKHEFRKEHRRKKERYKSKRRDAIIEYVEKMLVAFLEDEAIDVVIDNIKSFNQSKSYKLEPVNPNHNLTTWDIRHLSWNIGKRLGWQGYDCAVFAKKCFPVAMKDLEVDTIRRSLKQHPNDGSIKIDEPDDDDYRFHYEEED